MCKVKENINLKECYRCNSYEHRTNACTKSHICQNCAENHDTRKCPNLKEIKCINCLGKSNKMNQQLNADHKARSIDCPLHKIKIQIQQERTDYNAE